MKPYRMKSLSIRLEGLPDTVHANVSAWSCWNAATIKELHANIHMILQLIASGS